MNALSKKAKGAIIGSVAGVGALALGLGIWQPWKKPEVEDTKPPVEQQTQTPEQEEQLTLNVGGDKIPCTLFEGDGWSIYVPEGWTVDANKNGGIFYALGEDRTRVVQVEVSYAAGSNYNGEFVSISWENQSDGEERRVRHFYTGTEKESWELTCSSLVEEWSANEKLLTAMARTFAVGEERPFSGVSLAYEPDWQITEGKTVLWLDKNGYVVNDAVEKEVRREMLTWDPETQRDYTGKYRWEDLRWAGGYCRGPGEYIDVFETSVWYEIIAGKEDTIMLAGGMEIEDGWITHGHRLNVAITHDGSDVSEERALWCNDTSAGMPLFLSDLER